MSRATPFRRSSVAGVVHVPAAMIQHETRFCAEVRMVSRWRALQSLRTRLDAAASGTCAGSCWRRHRGGLSAFFVSLEQPGRRELAGLCLTMFSVTATGIFRPLCTAIVADHLGDDRRAARPGLDDLCRRRGYDLDLRGADVDERPFFSDLDISASCQLPASSYQLFGASRHDEGSVRLLRVL
jgi:hypothetical protein